jgi:ceramide glucosyltransferase
MLQIIATALLCLAGMGCALHVFATARLARFLRRVPRSIDSPPPLTFWRAVKPGLPDLEMQLDSLAAASHTEDQLLIGIDRESPDRSVCARWKARHPHREIEIIECEPDRSQNPKISKFCQMRPSARRDHWLLTDSEAILTREAADALRSEWALSGANALTAGYRFTHMRNAPQWLDSLPAPLTLWPGLMLIPRLTFTLGACTAVHARDIDAIGGWAALGEELAEDHELGRRLVRSGRSIALAHTVLDLEIDPLTLTDYLRHQHRLAATYRAANPLGFAGLPIFHVLPLAIVAALLHPAAWPFAIACAAIRIITAFAQARLLRMHQSAGFFFSAVVPMLEGLFWLAAWLPLRVWWAGRWRSISWRGRLA